MPRYLLDTNIISACAVGITPGFDGGTRHFCEKESFLSPSDQSMEPYRPMGDIKACSNSSEGSGPQIGLSVDCAVLSQYAIGINCT